MVDVLLARTVHLLAAGLWAGSVFFAATAAFPLARDGPLGGETIERLSLRLVWISRGSAVLLLLTGGHVAAAEYTAGRLVGSLEGQLVLAMTLLWAVLIGLVEVGTREIRTDGVGLQREPVVRATRTMQAAAVVAVGLLVVAGLLSGGVAAYV